MYLVKKIGFVFGITKKKTNFFDYNQLYFVHIIPYTIGVRFAHFILFAILHPVFTIPFWFYALFVKQTICLYNENLI